MPQYLWKTVNAQQESVYDKLNYYSRISAIYKKKLTSTNETIKSLLDVQYALIQSINKSTVNGFGRPKLKMDLNKISHCQLLTLRANMNAKTFVNPLGLSNICELI